MKFNPTMISSTEKLPEGQVAGCGIIIFNETNVLIGKRSSYKKEGAGQWCFPGGSVEVGETPDDAMVRELGEETGLFPLGIKQIASWLFENKKEFLYITSDVAGELKPSDEFEELLWISYSHLDTMNLFPPSRASYEIFKQYLSRVEKG